MLWLLVAAGVYTVLSTLAGAVLGLNRPILAGGHRSMWRCSSRCRRRAGTSLIENLRLQQVYDTIYANGARHRPRADADRRRPALVRATGPGRGGHAGRPTGPARVRMMLQQLGPTYVKIGQMMASRGDVLPAEWIEELAKLQSDAAPFPWADASDHRDRARQAARGAVRVDRPRAVRRRVDRAGPSGDAARRDRGGGQGPAAADRRQDEGRPRRHPGARHGRRAAGSAWPGRSARGRWSTNSPAASSRSSTTATRRTTPSGSRMAWPGSRRSTSRSSTTSSRASAS